MINKKGFTLIELLVVIAIIALLLSILIPSLSMTKELARRVICSTNLKSIGASLHMYSQGHNDKMIPNADRNGTEYPKGIEPDYRPWQAYLVGKDMGDPVFLKAIQLGKLFSLRYIEIPDVFYCPSAKRVVDATEKRSKRYYTEDIEKFMPPGKPVWGVPSGDTNCRSNYMYWTWEKTSIADLSNKPLVFDSLIRIAHEKSRKPHGMNVLFSDGHVSPTLASRNPKIVTYTERPWADRSDDYVGFVEVLRDLDP